MSSPILKRCQAIASAFCAQSASLLSAVDHFLLTLDEISSSPFDSEQRKQELLLTYHRFSTLLLHSLSEADATALPLGSLLEEADSLEHEDFLSYPERIFSQYEQYRSAVCQFLKQTEPIRKKSFSAHSSEIQKIRLQTQAFRHSILRLQVLFSNDTTSADGI